MWLSKRKNNLADVEQIKLSMSHCKKVKKRRSIKNIKKKKRGEIFVNIFLEISA